MLETRSQLDLDQAVRGLIAPVVLIDLEELGMRGLGELERVCACASDARVIVLIPAGDPELAAAVLELGATHVVSGTVSPRDVFALMGRWIALARQQIDQEGWHRRLEADARAAPWAWLREYGVGMESPRPETPEIPPSLVP